MGGLKSLVWPYYAFSGGSGSNYPKAEISKIAGAPTQIKCQQAIPPFALDYNSNPNQFKVDKFCYCVAKGTKKLNREVSKFKKNNRLNQRQVAGILSYYRGIFQGCGYSSLK